MSSLITIKTTLMFNAILFRIEKKAKFLFKKHKFISFEADMTLIYRVVIMEEKICKKFISVRSFLIFKDISIFRDVFVVHSLQLMVNLTLKMKGNVELLC